MKGMLIFRKPEQSFSALLYCIAITVILITFSGIIILCDISFSKEIPQHSLVPMNVWNKNIISEGSNSKKIIFQKKDNHILFANRYNGLELIDTGRNLVISNLYGFERSQDYISSEKDSRSSLWVLKLRKDSGRNSKEVLFSGLDDAVTSISLDRSIKGRATLVLKWKGLSINSEKNVI